jgi:hypothetical protein
MSNNNLKIVCGLLCCSALLRAALLLCSAAGCSAAGCGLLLLCCSALDYLLRAAVCNYFEIII